MLTTGLNLLPPHHRSEQMALGPRGPAKRSVQHQEKGAIRNKAETLDTLCMLILTVHSLNCVSLI